MLLKVDLSMSRRHRKATMLLRKNAWGRFRSGKRDVHMSISSTVYDFHKHAHTPSAIAPGQLLTGPQRHHVDNARGNFVCGLQDKIVAALEALDLATQSFHKDAWQHPQGGSGKSCVFSSPTPSTILEKAGVNISLIGGTLPPAAMKQMRADHTTIPLPENQDGDLPFYAAGLSLVIPRNPHALTAHANYRYFEITSPSGELLA